MPLSRSAHTLVPPTGIAAFIRSRGSLGLLAAAALFVAGAGCAHVDERTASEHEQEAERLRGAASAQEATVRTADVTQPVQSGSEAARTSGLPLQEITGGAAGRELARAEAHEAAARHIREGAEIACRNVTSVTRESCPLPLDARVEQVPGGVRVVPSVAVTAEELRGRVGCALAWSRVERPADSASCPLYSPGASARVVDRPAGAVVEITAVGEHDVDELRRRAARRAAAGAPR